jgi:hypothetical protein
MTSRSSRDRTPEELATAPALGEFARRGSAQSFKAIVRLHYKIKREHPLSDG